jgi:AraC family transcriptional regulator
MEPQIQSKSAFTVVGMKYRGKNQEQEIPALWREFAPRIDEIKHRTAAHDSYGVMDNYDEATGEFDYLSAVEVTSAGDLPQGMIPWQVPENKYAVLSFKFSQIQEAFRAIYAWIPESGHQRAPGAEFEYYPETFDPEDPESLMYLYVPIK